MKVNVRKTLDSEITWRKIYEKKGLRGCMQELGIKRGKEAT